MLMNVQKILKLQNSRNHVIYLLVSSSGVMTFLGGTFGSPSLDARKQEKQT
jgi:hypothetical protein